MLLKLEPKSIGVSRLLWLASLMALGTAAYTFSLGQTNFYIKWLVPVVSISLSLLALINTNEAKDPLIFWFESLSEVKKIVWPNKPEVIQTCIAIFAMVIIMGILLWTIDYILGRLMNGILLGGF